MTAFYPSDRSRVLAERAESFVREVMVPYERDLRCGPHGPADDLARNLRAKAGAAGVLTPHILPDGDHLTQRETAVVLRRSGLSLLAPVAVNTMVPDEGMGELFSRVAQMAWTQAEAVDAQAAQAR